MCFTVASTLSSAENFNDFVMGVNSFCFASVLPDQVVVLRTLLDLNNGCLRLSVPSLRPVGFRGLLRGEAIYHLWAGTIRVDLEGLGRSAAEPLL